MKTGNRPEHSTIQPCPCGEVDCVSLVSKYDQGSGCCQLTWCAQGHIYFQIEGEEAIKLLDVTSINKREN